MNTIFTKQITLRRAAGMALVLCTPETIDLIRRDQVTKGNTFEFARAAGFLGAKNTQHLLPHCHPVSIEGMDFHFDLLDEIPGGNATAESLVAAGTTAGTAADPAASLRPLLDERLRHRSGILIRAEASSVGRTGIEMEVLTGISIAALEVYDFLKPHDKTLEITSIRLLEKTGGKSDRRTAVSDAPECAVLVCSDSLAAAASVMTAVGATPAGEGMGTAHSDISGKLAGEILSSYGAKPIYYKLVADNRDQIQEQLREWISQKVPYIFTCGGTGLDPKDLTVEAVRELLDKDAPGVGETMRAYGRTLVPTAILSAAVAGVAGESFIVTLPGSPAGVKESLTAILPAVFHAGLMMKGKGHK